MEQVGQPENHDANIDSILRSKQEELQALMAAIAAEEPDIDLKIATIVEGESEEVKLGIIAHVRDMIRQREEDKAREVGMAQTEEQKRVHEAQRSSFRQWLVWLMSETTLKKLKLAALIPLLRQQEVKDIGQALAERGVTMSLSATHRKELGQLSQMTQQAKDAARERGR